MGCPSKGLLTYNARGSFTFEQGAEFESRVRARFGDLSRMCCLDLGCGPGETVIARDILRLPWQRLISIDAFGPYVEKIRMKSSGAKQHDIHHLRVENPFPFLEGIDVDLVLLIDVLEHLARRDALKLLCRLEKKARRGVVLFSPTGQVRQGALDGNRFQRHRSFWEADDWLRLGYDVEVYEKFHGHLDPPETAAWATKVFAS